MPRPSRCNKVVRSSSPLVPRVRRGRAAPVASPAPATRHAPTETITSASVATPNATMIQGIAKAVSEAVIQSLTSLTMSNQSASVSALTETPHLIVPSGQMPLYRGLWLLLSIISLIQRFRRFAPAHMQLCPVAIPTVQQPDHWQM